MYENNTNTLRQLTLANHASHGVLPEAVERAPLRRSNGLRMLTKQLFIACSGFVRRAEQTCPLMGQLYPLGGGVSRMLSC